MSLLPYINSTYTSSAWGLFEYANLVSGNAFGHFLFAVITIVVLAAFVINEGFRKGLTYGGFVAILFLIPFGTKGIILMDLVNKFIMIYGGWLIYVIYDTQK